MDSLNAAWRRSRRQFSQRIRALVLCATAWFTPSSAWAAETADSGDTETMLFVVALVMIVAVAYLLAHFVAERLQRVFLVLTGLEYVLLGVLLGPHMPTPIPAFAHLDPLLPIVALAVGWIGLLRGMELSIPHLQRGPRTHAIRIATVQGLCAGVLTGGCAYLIFTGLIPFFDFSAPESPLAQRDATISAAVLACVAAGASIEPMRLLNSRYLLNGRFIEITKRTAATSDLMAIFAFGLVFCIFHPQAEDALVQPSATEWAVITVLLGVLLGILFTPFLGDDDSENGRFLAMVGIITFAAGAAFFLKISTLLVNLCLGAVLINTAKDGTNIRRTLERTSRPMALLLLIFAGALLRPPPSLMATGALAAGFILLRFVGKAAGTRLASIGTDNRPDLSRGLMSHGSVSMAMAVSYRLVFEGPMVDTAYAVILISVVVNDLLAPRMLRGLLVDTGDISGEQRELNGAGA